MLRNSIGHSVLFYHKTILKIAVALFMVIFVWACGGGGGGGDDNDISDDPSPAFPSVVQYTAGSPVDFSGSGISLALEGGGTVDAGFFLEGRYVKRARTYTLASHAVARITVSAGELSYPLLYSDFGIQIEQPLQWMRGMHPTAGQFRTVPGNTVRVTVTADAGDGQPGVDIELIEFGEVTASNSLTWEAFDTVLSNSVEWDDYIVMAAFEYQVIRWVYDQVQLGIDGIEFVTLNDAALSAAGSGGDIEQTCDLFPYNDLTGSLYFTWFDGPGEIADALGAGDSFEAEFDDCWTEEAGELGVWIRSGMAEFMSYWEDPATLTLGFQPVVLNDVVETATIGQGASLSLGDTVTVNSFGIGSQNGFNLITRPDTSSGINLTNAVDLAAMTVESLYLPPEVGNVTLGLLTGFVDDPSFELCDISGSVNIEPAPTSATAVPASFDVTFSDCRMDPADPVTINGTATLDVTSVTGGTLAALTGDDFSASLTIESLDVDSTDDVGTVNLTGGSRFARTAISGDYTETSQSVAGGLSSSEAGVTLTLQAYTVASTLDTVGQYSYGQVGDVMTVNVNDPSGTFSIAVIQPIEGSESSAPVSGELRIDALDGSTLTMTVNHGIVTLSLDTDGDGLIDDTLVRDWDDIY